MQTKLKITHLYPKHMSLYGDRGNIITLLFRAKQIGVELELQDCFPNQPIDKNTKLILLGGGQDHDQEKIFKDLLARKNEIKDLISHGTIFLGICGGYQLLGKSYEAADGQVLEGLDLLDLTTRKAKAASKRIIGNVRVYSEVFGDLLGFENHGGRTYLGEGLKPLGKVLRGGGNNGEDGLEGVFQNYGKGLILGTYFHGFIPKNIQVADYLIQKITGNSYTQALIQDSVIENLNTLNGINLAY